MTIIKTVQYWSTSARAAAVEFDHTCRVAAGYTDVNSICY